MLLVYKEMKMSRVVPSQVVELIDKLFPGVIDEIEGRKELSISAGQADRLQAVIDLVQQIPGELLVLDSHRYAALITSLANIRTAISLWHSHGHGLSLDKPPAFGNLSPVALIRQALTLCPDEYPTAGTAELNFISDNDFRDSLRRDISTVNQALSNGEWKAATVLSGSIIEALLLWALQQRPRTDITNAVNSLIQSGGLSKRPPSSLEEWTLHLYIEVAAEISIISKDTAIQVRLAKDFRNLIHPGRAVRLGQLCNRATALTAVAAVEHVVQNLTP
jgi:hypothetical protein